MTTRGNSPIHSWQIPNLPEQCSLTIECRDGGGGGILGGSLGLKISTNALKISTGVVSVVLTTFSAFDVIVTADTDCKAIEELAMISTNVRRTQTTATSQQPPAKTLQEVTLVHAFLAMKKA